MKSLVTDQILTIYLEGRIDSTTSSDTEKEIFKICDSNEFEQLVFDVDKVQYFSSAGLRVLLRTLKRYRKMKVVNASPDVYDIMEMTGFTEILSVEKGYRHVTVEGCTVIGKGAKGTVYRLDPETIIKVYYTPDSVDEIHKERKLARTAFILGIPTAISYDVVKAYDAIKDGEFYGSVFELLNATSLSKMLQDGTNTVEECVKLSIDLLKIIHGTEVEPDQMPPVKDKIMKRAKCVVPYLPEQIGKKLIDLMEAIPDDNHMLHGDYHMKNVMVQDGEPLLIDMDTICYGHPIFELALMYTAYIGFGEVNEQETESFFDLSKEVTDAFWKQSLAAYLDTDDQARINDVETKASIISYVRILERLIRKGMKDTEKGKEEFEYYKAKLCDYVDQTSELTF